MRYVRVRGILIIEVTITKVGTLCFTE